MKRLCLLFLLASSALAAGDILQQLNVPQPDASSELVNALVYGSVGYNRVAYAFKSAAPSVRAAMTEQVLAWAKAYVGSPQFAKEYAELRNQQKPEPPQYEKTVDEQIKANHAQQLADLEESKKTIAALPAEQKKAMEEALKRATDALKAQQTPEQLKMQRSMLQAERDEAKKGYDQSLADYQKKYPANARDLVKQRLRELLTATANVDFAAKLVNDGGRKKFANAEYESKPAEWKLAFRAGKETTEKARAFATAWLAELK